MGIKLNTSDVIKHCAYETELNGYIKRSDNQDVYCTADRVLDSITKDLISDKDLESVKDRTVKWYEYINKSNGEYFESIKTELSKPKIDENKIGLIASSFSLMDKNAIFAKANELEKSSEYLGEEGDTITFNIKSHRLIKSGMSKFGNGTSSKWYLYKIVDEYNNVIMWFANSDNEFEFKHCNKASAMISKLQVYNDVKQTSVTKLKFLDD